MLLVILTVLAQAQGAAPEADGVTPAVLAGILTAAVTSGAALMGAYTAWRKRKDEAHKMESEEDSITITQAQGANLILDATVKALNTQLDRERVRADQAESRVQTLATRVEVLSDALDAEKSRAETAEKALAVARGQLADFRRGGE